MTPSTLDFDASLAPIPRRTRQATPVEPAPLASFMVTPPGEAPTVIHLPQRLAGWLRRLAEATATTGALRCNGNCAAREAMTELGAAGVPITACREPRTDGGSGWTAAYRLEADVEVHHG